MKSVKPIKKAEEKDWTTPGVKLTHEEFVAGIRKAEEGPFFTPEEFESRFEKWKKKKGTDKYSV
jgi:predicted transcriptional regulator